jgi:FixJ family two-component response regulator
MVFRMSRPPTHIYIVDDEASMRDAYARLLRAAGMQSRTFASVEEFLSAKWSGDNACVVADVRMPGVSGLDLPGLLQRQGRTVPVIFVTAHDTEETRTLALRAGAAGYFRKPVDDQALLDAIEWALSHGHEIKRIE